MDRDLNIDDILNEEDDDGIEIRPYDIEEIMKEASPVPISPVKISKISPNIENKSKTTISHRDISESTTASITQTVSPPSPTDELLSSNPFLIDELLNEEDSDDNSPSQALSHIVRHEIEATSDNSPIEALSNLVRHEIDANISDIPFSSKITPSLFSTKELSDVYSSLLSLRLIGNSDISLPLSEGRHLSDSILRVEPLSELSTLIDNGMIRDGEKITIGLVTSLLANTKYIGIGTSRGFVLLFDHYQQVAAFISENSSSVTALDLSGDFDYLLIGRSSGVISIYCLSTKQIIITIEDCHRAIITAARFWRADSLRFVSVDSNGITHINSVKKMFFSWINDSELLLDGKVGVVYDMAVLLPNHNKAHPSDNRDLIAIATANFLLIVSLAPEVKILFRIPKPCDFADISPSLAWRSATLTMDSSIGNSPVLAVAWGNVILLIEVKSSMNSLGTMSLEANVNKHPIQEPVLGIQWIGEQILCVLSNAHEIIAYDTFASSSSSVKASSPSSPSTDLELLDRINIRYLGIISHRHFAINCFSSFFKSSPAGLLLIGLRSFIQIRILSFNDRINSLVEKGAWLDALSLGLDFYDGKIPQSYGLPKAKEARLRHLSDRLATLLLSYLSYELKASNIISKNMSTTSGVLSILITLSIDYCIRIHRIDFLFSSVYSKFVDISAEWIFLQHLEPFILQNRLTSLPSPIFTSFIERYNEHNRLKEAEQCLLHLSIDETSFEHITNICKEKHLFLAYNYFYNSRADYLTPLQTMMHSILNHTRLPISSSFSEVQLPYCMLLFCHFVMIGKRFPDQIIDDSVKISAKVQILRFFFTSFGTKSKDSISSLPISFFFNLCSDEIIDILNIALSSIDWLDILEAPSPQYIIDTLIHSSSSLLSETSSNNYSLQSLDKSKIAKIDNFYLFIAKSITNHPQLNVPYSFLRSMVTYFLSIRLLNTEADQIRHSQFEKFLLDIFSNESSSFVEPLMKNDADFLIERASLIGYHSLVALFFTKKSDFSSALSYYLKDPQANIFEWIQKVLNTNSSSDISKFQESVLENLPKLVSVNAHQSASLLFRYFKVKINDALRHLTVPSSSTTLQLQFQFLKQILSPHNMLSNEPSINDLLERAGIEITPDIHDYFFKLLCQFAPNEVHTHLIRHQNKYSIDKMLHLCQSFGIRDASAFLLERTGDIFGALNLILGIIEDSVISMKNFFIKILNDHDGSSDQKFKKMKQSEKYSLGFPAIQVVERSVSMATDLCLRYSKHQDEETEKLWFSLFDRFTSIQSSLQLENKQRILPSQAYDLCMLAMFRFVRQIIGSMMTNVSLPAILKKITQDHHSHHLREFRETIQSMIDTYCYESSILSTVVRLLSSDLNTLIAQLRKKKSSAFVPNSELVCSLCHLPLRDSSSLSSRCITIFDCSHIFHPSCNRSQRCSLCNQTSSQTLKTALNPQIDESSIDNELVHNLSMKRLEMSISQQKEDNNLKYKLWNAIEMGCPPSNEEFPLAPSFDDNLIIKDND